MIDRPHERRPWEGPPSSAGGPDFVEDADAPEEENARRFFGFSASEPLDAMTLRARKMKREDEAQGPGERERAQRYFEVLAPSAGIKLAPRSPPPEQRLGGQAPLMPVPVVEIDPGASPAARSILLRLRRQLEYALHTEVIEHTIVAYNQLFETMVQLAAVLGVRPEAIANRWVRSRMQPPAPETLSRPQLREVLELLPEGLHVSLGGTPEFNHPEHRYVARAPEARLGLQFEYVINAVRDRALELLGN
jgi:hypothetical protein